ncbi:methyltransferase [Celerinatantimonas yamalensis]|uniref:Methyltransferase n=1 Tax=Celerinatantimonas yamalensis TaxID=559956 RepID=A0ABW9G9I0_9GAMM
MIQQASVQFDTHLRIERFPRPQSTDLQAWNSADRLLIEHVKQQIDSDQTLAIFNDDFGALSCALANYSQYWYSDSWLAHQALAHNRSANQLTVLRTRSTMEHPAPADAWLIKVPKNLAHLAHQLALISQVAKPNQPIILVSMVKFLSKGVFKLVEQYLGPLTTSLAQQKARLIFSHLQKPATPCEYPLRWHAAPYPWQLDDHANVFCLGKLDIGTRFLLNNLPKGHFSNIIDLGCGNGLLSLAARKHWPDAQIISCDESLMAVESATINMRYNYPDAEPRYQARADHCLSQQSDNWADLILCNPPFHQQQTISTAIAQQMFTDAYRALNKEGQLCIVANRHLPYPHLLKKQFGGIKVLASNPKFVILVAIK